MAVNMIILNDLKFSIDLSGKNTLAYLCSAKVKFWRRLTPGSNVIKLFRSQVTNFRNKLECVRLASLSSLVHFVSKARSLPSSVAPERGFTWVDSVLTRKRYCHGKVCQEQTL
jgi:hypothetical protein